MYPLSQTQQNRLLRYMKQKEKKQQDYKKLKIERKEQSMQLKQQFHKKLTVDRFKASSV